MNEFLETNQDWKKPSYSELERLNEKKNFIIVLLCGLLAVLMIGFFVVCICAK